jgi:dihydrodipicolinate synthase/N-acetylneuraminate lyase
MAPSSQHHDVLAAGAHGAAWRQRLYQGTAIPAHPLALTAERRLDERHQRALTRYYLAAGAGGVAVGVHTTQFQIREAGLYRPVLALAAEEMRGTSAIGIAGICGRTTQAVEEAATARDLGYHAGLLSLGAMRDAPVDALLEHARAVGEVIPLVGFYLQPAVGGRALPLEFWRRFAGIESVVAIKIAPFNRYQTQDVLRGVCESGRADEIALYTGNDDHIVLDLLTAYRCGGRELRMRGGLLGHWAVWTRRAVELLGRIHTAIQSAHLAAEWLSVATEVTDTNAALFDAANQFRGCIAGINEVLRRQGLLATRLCLDPAEDLSPGQAEEIDRMIAAHPSFTDDDFVRENLDRWLA